MSTWGMDVGQIRQLAQLMSSKADEIQQIMQQLSSQLEAAPWTGPDRNQFLGEWQGTHCAQLTAVINGLHTASTKATTNASQQEQASSS